MEAITELEKVAVKPLPKPVPKPTKEHRDVYRNGTAPYNATIIEEDQKLSELKDPSSADPDLPLSLHSHGHGHEHDHHTHGPLHIFAPPLMPGLHSEVALHHHDLHHPSYVIY